LINTRKARWLISRALALGFYPNMGGDARAAVAIIECCSMKINMLELYVPVCRC